MSRRFFRHLSHCYKETGKGSLKAEDRSIRTLELRIALFPPISPVSVSSGIGNRGRNIHMVSPPIEWSPVSARHDPPAPCNSTLSQARDAPPRLAVRASCCRDDTSPAPCHGHSIIPPVECAKRCLDILTMVFTHTTETLDDDLARRPIRFNGVVLWNPGRE